MEESFVYFAIANEGFGNSALQNFLEHLKDEFRKIFKKGSRRTILSMNSLSLQEQLSPIVHKLVLSLVDEWPIETPPVERAGFSLSGCKDAKSQTSEGAVSTKVPLLGRPEKPDKRKMKEHVISVRDIELEEIQRKSIDRREENVENSSQCGSGVVSSSPIQKNRQVARNKWCHLVRTVLAIDVGVCLALFIVWLVICRGFKCVR